MDVPVLRCSCSWVGYSDCADGATVRTSRFRAAYVARPVASLELMAEK